MPLRPLIALFFCSLTAPAWAIPLMQAPLSPGEQCRAGILAAERGHAIPAQLLSSIGRVESGRRDPGTGAWGAWPWTLNAEGQGAYFETKAEAIKAVQALQARGVRSIDVGCMQVNLMHHPNAFPNLDMAFEPAVNADYAAKFLSQLHDQAGDWTKATANYHSAYPPEGGPYAAKVLAIWPEEQRKAGMAPPPLTAPGPPGLFARSVPPRAPPSMFAMNGITPGRPSAGMLRGESGLGGTGVAPPGMMQGGTIPAGVVPPGYMTSRMAAPGGSSAGTTPAGAGPAGAGQTRGVMAGAASPQLGRALDSYRAAPIGIAMPARLALRVMNRFTMR
jgi:hypothetical protein